ncbi:MAG: hypothetical protein CMK07_12965 [Ponticaulis sp.]|nr:hypothetical protein [Ponticaulis sp.]
MRRHLACFLAPVALFILPAEAQDQAFINAAYETCIMHMKHHLPPPSEDGIVFAPVENVVIADDYEVLISFPIGAITGADSAEPNDLTGSVQAAGSCIASPRAEEITRIVVNGEVVNHRTIAVHP